MNGSTDSPTDMKLITEVKIPEYPFRLDHHSPVLMMGSCFTEEVGKFLHRYLFPVCINPFGVTYNPLSLLGGLKALIEKEGYVAGDLEQHNGQWFSFDHYTLFSHPDREKALKGINLQFHQAKGFLENASFLILTWGTAWVYRLRSTDRVVNNCHKLPSREFNRSRLTPRQIIEAYEQFLTSLFRYQPGLKILFTVSPVRHWKDGAHGNQLSKSVLLLAGEALQQTFPEHCFYFPSYEIVMDELRDYRYFGADLVHTNDIATEYIWEKFSGSLIHEESRFMIRALEPLLKLKAHRSIQTEGPAFEQMVGRISELKQTLQNKYPDLAWDNWERSGI
jgi:hypothetical protein